MMCNITAPMLWKPGRGCHDTASSGTSPSSSSHSRVPSTSAAPSKPTSECVLSKGSMSKDFTALSSVT